MDWFSTIFGERFSFTKQPKLYNMVGGGWIDLVSIKKSIDPHHRL
jgi:hypothetical protein